MKKRKFSFFSLGCKVNQAEMESLSRFLLQNNWEIASINEKAHLCVINTCTVTNRADRKSRQKIRRVIKDNPGSFIIVTGCYAQAAKEEIKSISGVNLVIDNSEKNRLSEIISKRFLIGDTEKTGHIYSDFISYGRTRTFLKIQDGCDNFCSYCIIPFVRGNPHSMPPEEVIKRIKSLTLAGYKEIVITGINLGSYGKDFPLKFALTDLLNLICEKTPLERLRLSSIESLDINKAFLEMFNKYPVLCNHLHIPLQHGHNSILHNMNRNYTVEQYREIINLARERIKDLAITTDVMVGFPGEKEEYFSSTRNFLQEMQLSKIHVFSYSPRKGTVAFNMKEQVSEEIKNERSRILLELSKKMAGSFYRKFIGQSLSVLFEHRLDKKTGLLKGLTTNYIPVTIEGRENCFGKILMVNIIGLKEEALFGEIISEQ